MANLYLSVMGIVCQQGKFKQRKKKMDKKLSVCFSGWLNIPFSNLLITDCNDEKVNVEDFTQDELLNKLNAKELFVDFVVTVRDSRDFTVEMFYFSTEENTTYFDQDGNKIVCYNS